jgi:hypothetical protein
LRILALLTIGSVTVSAQLSRDLVAKVPFDFVAGYKSFPAGEYRVSSGPAQGLVTVRSLDGKTSGFVMSHRAESVKTQTNSRLIFNRYADRYFLSQIWVEGDTSGAQLRKTPAELEAAERAGITRESVIGSRSPKR